MSLWRAQKGRQLCRFGELRGFGTISAAADLTPLHLPLALALAFTLALAFAFTLALPLPLLRPCPLPLPLPLPLTLPEARRILNLSEQMKMNNA